MTGTYSPRSKLSTPAVVEYEFPHEPYAIQQQLMDELFLVLEEKGVGIFESPTGTGKSLTLTCAALCWLERHEAMMQQDLRARIKEVQLEIGRLEVEGACSADWITVQHASKLQQEELRELQTLWELLQEQEERLRLMRENVKKQKIKKEASVLLGKQDFDLENPQMENFELENETKMNEENRLNDDNDETVEEKKTYRSVQIFFCSRTHTQLAQVVREVKRTSYGRRIRCISLASRQQLCIHPVVKKLTSAALVNERCLDMIQNKNSAMSSDSGNTGSAKKKVRVDGCPFRKQHTIEELTENALVNVLDIEELVDTGKQLRACPYYSARAATQDAQLVLLPYQMLLHRRTRQQSGIDLRGAVIIIDEAHNLLDTISQLHSCELTLSQLSLAQQQINAYKQNYAKRFSSVNLLCINQLLYVIKRLLKLLQPQEGNQNGKDITRLLRSYELTAEGEFFNVDLFRLLDFCERTRFAQKLQGFAQRRNEQQSDGNSSLAKQDNSTVGLLQRLQQEHMIRTQKHKAPKPDLNSTPKNGVTQETKPELHSSTSPIRPLMAFLSALTEQAEDGRVLLQTSVEGNASVVERCFYKYLLLNPGAHFQDILHEARAIIVAGGTMQPTVELTDQLFRSCPERVRLRFYDHVVSANSILAFAVATGPSGRSLCFNYAQRSNKEMLTELGMVLQNVCNVVPAGVICFLPSYDYLDAVYSHLDHAGVLRNISIKKCIFREPRSSSKNDQSQSVQILLEKYSSMISNKQGALLLSIVGGKLSEGLNFADDLGRGVIVVGMPYPNRQSPELQERMQYLDNSLGAGAGNDYYENLCMKAVNQCVGRSVRHIHDYACVFLLDERYTNARIQQKLPQWIMRSLQRPKTFGMMQSATAKFFKQKHPI